MSSSSDARRFAPLGAVLDVDADADRRAAQALGYAQGWSQGQHAASAAGEALRAELEREHDQNEGAARAQIDQALAGLRAATQQVVGGTAALLEDTADHVLAAAVSLARAIIDAELSVMDDVAVQTLRRALAPLPTDAVVNVRLSAADHDELVGILGFDTVVSVAAHQVKLVRDVSLRRGDAVADQAGSVVDARIDAALARALATASGWQR